MLLVLSILTAIVTVPVPGVRCGRGAIQFRLSEEEFSKVSKVLVSSSDSYVSYKEGSTLIEGSTDFANYSITGITITAGDPTSVNVTIPKDDHLIAMTNYDTMIIGGYFAINSTSEKFVIEVADVSIRAEGKVIPIGIFGIDQHIVLNVPHCSVLSLTLDPGGLPSFVFQYLTDQELNSIFKDTICQLYYMKFSLGFEVGNLWVNLALLKVTIYTHAIHLQIKNSTIMVTQMLQPAAGQDIPLLPVNDYDIPEFPPLRENAEPFEMWINEDIFSDVWHIYKQESSIGAKAKPLSELIPLLDFIDDIDTGRVPYMFQLYETYPNATVKPIVHDVDLGIHVNDGEAKMFINVTGDFVVTLNCNRNRTYSAFNFSMFIYIPTQMALDNKYMTFQLIGFGGNMTIINSSIGHVATRHLSVIVHNIPQLIDPYSAFEPMNKHIKGIRINQLLPKGLFTSDNSLSMEQGHIVLGGELTDTASDIPEIMRENLTWIGDLSILEDLYFPLTDLTPENLTATSEKNCSVFTNVISGATSILSWRCPMFLSNILFLTMYMSF